jgi:hypothetical protein
LIPVSAQRRRISFSLGLIVRFWCCKCVVAGRLQNSGRLINRVSGDPSRCVEKLADDRFAAPFVAAQQRRKFGKYELHRWNIAQHSGQFRKNWKRF